MARKDDLIARITEQGDFERFDNGYLYYYVPTRGGMSASDLRIVADYLDEQNASWQANVDEYFSKSCIDDDVEM